MESYFESVVQDICACTNEIECRLRIVTTIRLLLQQINYGMLEWIAQQNPPAQLQPEHKFIQPLMSPTDGTLVDALEALLISAEQVGWSGASKFLIKSVEDRPATRISTGGASTTIGLLRTLVTMRNDGAEGHGLAGGYDREAEIDALKFIFASLKPVIPRVQENKSTLDLGPGVERKNLTFLRAWNGVPALIRRIKVLASDRVRAYCQIALAPTARNEFNYDTSNPFHRLQGSSLPALAIWDNSWGPLCYVPERTTDSFTGRQKEISDLADWSNDEESRACLIFGDGGLGKTTLAIEFLHQVLEEEHVLEWKPAVVIFYTAKRTQWGLTGLTLIGVGQPHLVELLAFLHMLFFSRYPESDFYRLDVSQAATRLQTLIKSQVGFSRKDILIVIDNTETLIESEDERAQLGREIKEIGRRVGRVLLTSRRRELMEAYPIGIDVLSEADALQFLKDRAKRLNIKVILRATDDDLMIATKSLERRPIVLETFVNAAADPAVRRLDQARARVAAMLQKDLGEFLFADAWTRLSLEARRLLLLMTRIGDVHDAQSLRICSAIVGVPAQIAEQALEESGGIASKVNVQGGLQITFSRNFLDFARTKTISAPDGSNSPSNSEIDAARLQYSKFIQNAQKFSGDRVAEAFRTPQARASHRARQEGRLDDARRLYEAATLTDSTNGWLRDRFAYFLFHDSRDYEAALHQAVKAVELLPHEGEVWFTRGLIEARLGMARQCELSLAKANQLGVAQVRCDVQRTWAYLKSRPVQFALAERELRRLDAYAATKPDDTRLLNEIGLLKSRLSYVQAKKRPQ